MHIPMDTIKLEFSEMYQLHNMLNCTSQETTEETLQHIEYLANLPMLSKEAKNIIPIVKEYIAELSITYEDTDFYAPDEILLYKEELEHYHNIMRELIRIANLDTEITAHESNET